MASVAHDELTETGSILSGPVELPDFPAWFRDQQRVAWKEFEALPRPTRKDQAWRFSNVDLLDVTSFKFAGALGDEERAAILEQSRGLDEVAGRMTFAGDQLIERDGISDQLKKRGVIFQSLERAMVGHAERFRQQFRPATNELDDGRSRCFSYESQFASGFTIFALRKSQPADRRRRA